MKKRLSKRFAFATFYIMYSSVFQMNTQIDIYYVHLIQYCLSFFLNLDKYYYHIFEKYTIWLFSCHLFDYTKAFVTNDGYFLLKVTVQFLYHKYENISDRSNCLAFLD